MSGFLEPAMSASERLAWWAALTPEQRDGFAYLSGIRSRILASDLGDRRDEAKKAARFSKHAWRKKASDSGDSDVGSS